MTNSKQEEIHIPAELSHFLKVLDMGAKKYGANSWLSGNHFDAISNQKSIQHHLLESNLGIREDHESGLDPLLHAACRIMMEYTLRSRGMIDTKTGKVITSPQEPVSKHEHDWGFDVKKTIQDK